MPAIVNPKLDPADPAACPSIETAPQSVVILEIDNLLVGWPTYVINYTPDQPGPVKIILRLKDAKRYVWIDDEDSENEEGATATDQKKQRVATITIDLTESEVQANTSAKAVTIDATPVELHGIAKDIKPIKKRVFDTDDSTTWPPPRPRAFCQVSTNRSMTSFTMLKTIPAAVQATSMTKKNTV